MALRIVTLITLLSPALAHAHHAMDYALLATVSEGLLSGLAHPVIGIDHLLFVLAVGVACHVTRAPVRTGLVFIAGTLAGTLAHLTGLEWSGFEAGIALTLIGLGVLLLLSRSTIAGGALMLGVCGLVHGYAYGAAVVGAEATPIVAYLSGYTAVQAALIALVYTAVRADRRQGAPALRQPVGLVLSLAGAAFLGLAVV